MPVVDAKAVGVSTKVLVRFTEHVGGQVVVVVVTLPRERGVRGAAVVAFCDGDGVYRGWVQDPLTDGYCVAGPCPGSSEAGTHGLAYGLPEVCGAGNICINYIDQMSGVGSGTCLAGCDNCDRAGYACHFMNFNAGEAEGEVIAVRGCLPACAANADCGEGSRCNAGVCEFECDAAAGPNGEPSAAALCAQSGGTCTAGDGGLEYCVY